MLVEEVLTMGWKRGWMWRKKTKTKVRDVYEVGWGATVSVTSTSMATLASTLDKGARWCDEVGVLKTCWLVAVDDVVVANCAVFFFFLYWSSSLRFVMVQ